MTSIAPTWDGGPDWQITVSVPLASANRPVPPVIVRTTVVVV